MSYDLNSSSYSYDAQNRLTGATVNGVTMSFAYDGLNRQVSRTAPAVKGGSTTTYSVWDGWNLIEEYTNNPFAIQGSYLYGPGGLIKNLQSGNYYYQDASGSTSHIADGNGTLLEWYRYDLQGTPTFYNIQNGSDHQIDASALGVRHLFTGQQWYSQIGLYDLRNRFYSPDLGRFLQPDPIGFRGGNNLYRYCGNNPVMRRDPSGLVDSPIKQEGQVPEVIVSAPEIPPIGTAPGVPAGIGFGPPKCFLQRTHRRRRTSVQSAH